MVDPDVTLTDTVPDTTPAQGELTPPETSPSPSPESGATPGAHPLEPGGERFEVIYARMKQAEREADTLRTRMGELERKVATPPPAAVTFYTPDQLQAAVDQGRITTAQMAAQLALQAKEQAKTEILAATQQEAKRTDAVREVDSYIQKLPALMDTGSEDFQRVARAAREIADDMNLPMTDARVQRRALRETLGPLERVQASARTQSHARSNADLHAETSRGGPAAQPAKAPEVLKNVPKEWVDYWRPRVANEKELLDLAKHYRPTRKFSRIA